MITRNAAIARLRAGYLFPEIARRRREFLAAHPDAASGERRVISLGVGNTTEPLLPHICAGLVEGARRLGSSETYSGYMDEGLEELRSRISRVFYQGAFSADEIFIGDGAKCDIGRLQVLFGEEARPAVQDPSYPVYVDGSVIMGAAKDGGECGYSGVTYLPCTAENGFFPCLSRLPDHSLLYFCSPNNPTGATLTRAQLEELIAAVRKTGSLLIFDAAYSCYIRDETLPKSVYEAEGAAECAIEVNSFSKSAGFTGVRLGWTVVPKALRYGSGESVNADWARVQSTIFNGASNIAQWGALSALDSEGLTEIKCLTDFYLENARLIRNAVSGLGLQCTGGENSPYIWTHFPGEDSWEVFTKILEQCRVVTTPGAGFGPAGEGYIRFSAFGHRKDVESACVRLGTLCL